MEGDSTAINEVIGQLEGRLRAAALRIDPSGRDTDDLMQVARVAVWHALPGLKKATNPSLNLLMWVDGREMKREFGRIKKRIKYELTKKGI